MNILSPVRKCQRLSGAVACALLIAFTAATAHSQLVLTEGYVLTNLNRPEVEFTEAFVGWRPLTSQADSTNQFVLVVTANNTPSLSATQSFAVVVNPITLPTLTQAAVSNGQFSLTLNGMAGPNYGNQVSSNLVVWQTIFSTDSPALPFTWLDTNSTAPMRLYRATLGPPLPP